MTDLRTCTAPPGDPARLPALGILLLGVLALSGGVPAGAAQAGRDDGGPFIDRVEVNVVNVEVFVTDKQGNPVPGLSRGDFELTVDGAATEISNFYAEQEDRPVHGAGPGIEPLPQGATGDRSTGPEALVPPEQRLRLMVFVDQTALQPLNRKRSFKHIRRFLEEGLAPEDEVAVVSLSPGLTFHTDFTADREAVAKVLKELEKRPALDLGTGSERRRVLLEVSDSTASNSLSGMVLSLIRAVASTEYQVRRSGTRALTALVDTFAGVPGRKAILHVSDGIPTRPGEDLFVAWQNRFGETARNYQTEVGSYDLIEDFRELAARANASKVTFYAVDADPPDFSYARSAEYQGDPSALPSVTTEVANTFEENKRATLELAALETGGRRVVANGRLPHQLRRIGSDFQSFYSLGFASSPRADGERHEVEVRVRGRKDLRVRHRSGFSDRGRDQDAAGRTLAALLYGVEEDPLGVTAEGGAAEAREDGTTVLPLAIEIPFDRLALLPEGDSRAATLSLFVTVQDEVGGARPVQRVAVQLRLPEENVDRTEGSRARYVLPVVLKPGDRRLALGVRDDVAGVISTLRIEVGGDAPGAEAPGLAHRPG